MSAHVCIHKACKCRVVWGHALPGNFFKLDLLSSLLRTFWDRSIAIEDAWPAEYCIQLWQHCIHVWKFAKPFDIKFPWEKAVGRPAGGVPDSETVCTVWWIITNNEAVIEWPIVVQSSSQTDSTGRHICYGTLVILLLYKLLSVTPLAVSLFCQLPPLVEIWCQLIQLMFIRLMRYSFNGDFLCTVFARLFITVTCLNVHVHSICQMQRTSAIKTCLDASVLNGSLLTGQSDYVWLFQWQYCSFEFKPSHTFKYQSYNLCLLH